MTLIKELADILRKFPIDSQVYYKNKAIGTVIGYKRANGTGALEVIFKHYNHLAMGRESMFSVRSRDYSSRVQS